MTMNYVRSERILLRTHPDFQERWVQDRIAEDPAILGLGDLVLRDRERIQPRAGRLDLLLQDRVTERRFELELQLGSTDETHIIRTIEYWDIERRRYPQYDHSAVIVAEDITSRFLNVISLFNGAIPLIALQMQALRVGNDMTLSFTKVVDELRRGPVDEDEDAKAAPADRAYWERKASVSTVAIVDTLLECAKVAEPALELKYNMFYIGMTRQGKPFNAVTYRPQKKDLVLGLRFAEAEEMTERIAAVGIETNPYSRAEGAYRLRLTAAELAAKKQSVTELMTLAIKSWEN